MLMVQHQFPNTYDETRDALTGADSDRISGWDYEHARRCCKEHTNSGDQGIGYWAQRQPPEKVLVFLKDLLKADPAKEWTGFRVLGTVHRSNGFVVWSLELFAKHPETDTPVYSGSCAPNVEQPARRFDAFTGDWGESFPIFRKGRK
jgi:hypothetical protein